MEVLMNTGKIMNIIGRILFVEVLLMLPSLFVSLIYRDGDTKAFVYTMIPAAIVSVLLMLVRQQQKQMSSRDGYFIVAMAWIIISIVGAFPLYLAGGFASYWGALFEIVSGFTTTGASVLAEPGTLGHGVAFWRCFTHWVGGMGVLVFVLMVIPMENDNSMHLVRAEVVILKCLGMKVFDAFCIGFGTAGTGGFALNSAGIAGYGSPAIEIVLGIFMILFGINFNTYFLLLLRKFKEALTSEETAVYFGVIGVSVVAISINILSCFSNTGEAVRSAFFQVASIITTTGFATVDFNLWPEFSKHLIVLLMIIGACAGSTGGGLKISRVIILFKSFIAEIKQILNPKEVVSIRLNGKNVDKKTLNSTRIYFGAYVILICIFTLIISLDGLDLTTNLTAVLSCFNNIGPGLNLVGPMENFGLYSDWVKVVLSLAMLTGRLEIFPMFLLFAKSAHDR